MTFWPFVKNGLLSLPSTVHRFWTFVLSGVKRSFQWPTLMLSHANYFLRNYIPGFYFLLGIIKKIFSQQFRLVLNHSHCATDAFTHQTRTECLRWVDRGEWNRDGHCPPRASVYCKAFSPSPEHPHFCISSFDLSQGAVASNIRLPAQHLHLDIHWTCISHSTPGRLPPVSSPSACQNPSSLGIPQSLKWQHHLSNAQTPSTWSHAGLLSWPAVNLGRKCCWHQLQEHILNPAACCYFYASVLPACSRAHSPLPFLFLSFCPTSYFTISS